MKRNKYKLAILTSHPIPYQTPLFQKLAEHPKIDLMVYFCSDFGVNKKLDPKFGIPVKWDKPLLEGYFYKFLKNHSPNPSTEFWGLINPGIIKELWRERYNAILVHGYTLFTSWLAFFGAWITRTPIIFRGETLLLSHQPEWRRIIKNVVLRPLFRRIKAFLPIGTRSSEFYSYYGVSKHKLFLGPYSVDNDYFFEQRRKWQPKKEKIKKELNIPFKLPIILYVGKIYKIKAPFDLLKAFEKIQEKAALIFVGEGEDRERLESYKKERNIKNVYFLGFKNQSELGKYYVVADIFVLPSIREKWGLVINEAMCFSLPIITTDGVTAAVDLVRREENGFIYLKGNIEMLIKYLKELISDLEKCKKMGEKSLKIISDWNYDVCEKAILKALEFISTPSL
ncbi:glycosyltransferase family 4 protein [Patescibacteria group bacterium]|nr:glycosyltransferase family 4 protein [Patescibacteria group bacterium]